MRIISFETAIVQPPIRHRGSLGVGKLDSVDNVLVWLRADGIEGMGEASPWPVFAENAWSVKAAIDHYLGPCLVGEDPRDVERLLGKMDAVHAGHPFAKAALEMALLDIAGKSAGLPVYRLLGGLVRDRIELSYSIANQDIEADTREILWLLDQGVRVFKVKTGVLPLAREIERLSAIRAVLPDDADLRLDFNQGLAGETALLTCRQLEAFRPTFMEQPVRGWDIEGLARIAQAIDTPIMADEAVFAVSDALRVVRLGAADMISTKIMKSGGIIRARKIAAICEAAGMPCYAGAMWESGIGIAASLHYAAATPNVLYGSDFYIPGFLLKDDLIVEPLQMAGRDILVPHGTGLGVELDRRAVEEYRIG